MAHIRWTYTKWSCLYKKIQLLNYRGMVSHTSGGGGFLQVSDEVRDAVASNRAVVALESTIITHGMPYPDNYRTALSVERRVKENGAVPAIIAIVKGKICVGVSEAQLMWLAEQNKGLIKVSRSDLSYVLSQSLSGGTTVSATMIAAHMAGIPVFATGGIGGVHRGAETSFDVSADLTELGRTSVAVVSSGVKSILDIAKTLEYLETQGVSVVTFGKNKNFPAFFTKDSGYCAPYSVATHFEAAKMIDVQLRTGLGSGMLIAVPIPDQFAATGELIQAAIIEAVDLARKNNIVGKEVTPYILSMVSELTKGESLAANIALIENNATVASGIASCLAKIRVLQHDNTVLSQRSSSPYSSSSSLTSRQTTGTSAFEDLGDDTRKISEKPGHKLPGRPVVVGASIVDFTVQVDDTNLEFNGATYKGNLSQSFGGVGRNLADCLSRLGCRPVFISAIGTDNLSSSVLQYCQHIDMHAVQKLDTVSTATYCPVLQASGELMFGVGNMDINSQFTLSKVSRLDMMIKSAPLVILDGNFTAEVIETVVLKCVGMSVPVWFEPTDLFKSTKPFTTDAWRGLTFISPNLRELVSMYLAMMERLGQSNGDSIEIKESSSLEDILNVSVQMCRKLVEYIPVVLVTLGEHGVLLCHGFGEASNLLPLPVTKSQTEQFKATYYRALSLPAKSRIVSVSGAGDWDARKVKPGLVCTARHVGRLLIAAVLRGSA